MKRETAKAIDAQMGETTHLDPTLLLLRAVKEIGECGVAVSDEDGDICAARAAAHLVAYLEWRRQ